jgi:protocatechuate 3,4-dioxygenase, beta subunit
METTARSVDRRRFLQTCTLSAAAFAIPGAFAQSLVETATTTEGPFYPDKMPLDTDNDLVILNDSVSPSVGQVTYLEGRVLTAAGEPIRNAFVEIWQADNTGSYVHTGGRQPSGYDKNFQGYGRFLTNSEGQYFFRTIKPIDYTLMNIFRAPHIHFAISRSGRRVFTTQMLVAGHPANARDSVIQRLDKKALQTLLVDFKPMPGSKIGELSATFEMVLGKTASEGEDGQLRGVGAPQQRRRPDAH